MRIEVRSILKWSIVFLLALLAAIAVMSFGDGSRLLFADASVRDKPLRLHVLANSDSNEDQQLKLMIRDQVIEYLEPILAACADKEEAMSAIADEIDNITAMCNVFLKDKADYKAKALLAKGDFPQIDYNGMVFAAGEYDSLRIVLGEGDGHNWWCVLFPPLCFVDMATEISGDTVSVWAPYGQEQGTIGPVVRWKLSELFS